MFLLEEPLPSSGVDSVMDAGLSERLLPALPVLYCLRLVDEEWFVGVGGGLSEREPGLLNRLTRAETDMLLRLFSSS